MALTKTSVAATQRTTAGNGDTLACATHDTIAGEIKHVNGTGTITAGAVVTVQIQVDSNSQWYTLAGSVGFGTTASAEETRVVDVPPSAVAVRCNYTSVPAGSTGHTLDFSISRGLA